MRLLFDQNISYRIVSKLPDYFADSKQVSHLGLNDCDDIDIWQFAHDKNYVIVTYDSDFYDISLMNGCPPKVIWLRTGNLTTIEIAKLLVANLEAINDFVNNPDMSEIACLEIE
jgi:predicted nuclease of predicted toxin-antitoxin system